MQTDLTMFELEEIFKTNWHAADAAGLVGNRTTFGIAAVLAALDITPRGGLTKKGD